MSERIETYNCRVGQKNAGYYLANTPEDLHLFIEKAHQAHCSGALQSIEVRLQLLNLILTKMENNKEKLCSIYTDESSLSLIRFEQEFERTKLQIKSYGEAACNLANLTIRNTLTDRIIEKISSPIGPIAVFGASNFPLAYSTLGGDVMGALASGCPVIVKGHSLHAGTSTLCANLIIESIDELSLHPGIFSHVLDSGFTLAHQLVKDARIKGCAFTGSYSGGMALLSKIQERTEPIPYFAEMGSLNPLIILNSFSEIESIVTKIVDSITNDAGQFCTKPGLIFYPREKHIEIYNAAIEAFKKSKGHPMLHPSIQKRYLGRLDAIEKHSRICDFKITDENFAIPRGFLSITTKSFLNHSAFHEEIFGPFCVLISYTKISEVEECLSCIPGQLTGTIFGNNPQNSKIFNTLLLQCGRIILNGVPTGVAPVEAMHHGGPFPATTDSRFSAVGEASINRFIRYVSIQNSH